MPPKRKSLPDISNEGPSQKKLFLQADYRIKYGKPQLEKYVAQFNKEVVEFLTGIDTSDSGEQVDFVSEKDNDAGTEEPLVDDVSERTEPAINGSEAVTSKSEVVTNILEVDSDSEHSTNGVLNRVDECSSSEDSIGIDETDLEPSEDDYRCGTIWSEEEKERFFTALGRKSCHDMAAISRAVGTKTLIECEAYYNLLKSCYEYLKRRKPLLSKTLQREIFVSYEDLPYSYEMTESWDSVENKYANAVIDAIADMEVEKQNQQQETTNDQNGTTEHTNSEPLLLKLDTDTSSQHPIDTTLINGSSHEHPNTGTLQGVGSEISVSNVASSDYKVSATRTATTVATNVVPRKTLFAKRSGMCAKASSQLLNIPEAVKFANMFFRQSQKNLGHMYHHGGRGQKKSHFYLEDISQEAVDYLENIIKSQTRLILGRYIWSAEDYDPSDEEHRNKAFYENLVHAMGYITRVNKHLQERYPRATFWKAISDFNGVEIDTYNTPPLQKNPADEYRFHFGVEPKHQNRFPFGLKQQFQPYEHLAYSQPTIDVEDSYSPQQRRFFQQVLEAAQEVAQRRPEDSTSPSDIVKSSNTDDDIDRYLDLVEIDISRHEEKRLLVWFNGAEAT
ncbi:RNA polymerase I upstream activation factor complex subunit Rrn5 [Sugiyamaella lignohabitans]|uniref:RNA polymerase I upstream activation factor complex subunit Rrn5 n=1 Tax=Sugiyamaella lignohabitans TaxID=796027 RepID=A0A167EA25_9ASCO|nr:RNA polymerase I upstream activation factor complex subunit Rrn5 [Sugiyamaella lignohabitans]ANB13824.1 RNA polymerase I upstream activation factor complex subunit Rrn5 [Sugiyamaella lignohabitans]